MLALYKRLTAIAIISSLALPGTFAGGQKDLEALQKSLENLNASIQNLDNSLAPKNANQNSSTTPPSYTETDEPLEQNAHTASYDSYLNQYKRQLFRANDTYESLNQRRLNDERYGASSGKLGSTPNPALNVSYLRLLQSIQDLMRTIRGNALKDGYSIPVAPEENYR